MEMNGEKEEQEAETVEEEGEQRTYVPDCHKNAAKKRQTPKVEMGNVFLKLLKCYTLI